MIATGQDREKSRDRSCWGLKTQDNLITGRQFVRR